MRPARIKRIRRKHRMTQAGLAKRLDVSLDTVRSWELDRSHPLGPAVILLKQLELGLMPK